MYRKFSRGIDVRDRVVNVNLRLDQQPTAGNGSATGLKAVLLLLLLLLLLIRYVLLLLPLLPLLVVILYFDYISGCN